MLLSIICFILTIGLICWSLFLFLDFEEEIAFLIGIFAILCFIGGIAAIPSDQDTTEKKSKHLSTKVEIKPDHPLASGILLYQEESPSPMNLTMGMYQVEISPADVLTSETDSVLQSWGWAKDNLSNSYIYK